MIFSCKCLNITINLGKTRPKDVEITALKLNQDERGHLFFSKGVAELEETPLITKQITALTISEILGNWTVESCLNCCLPFYAHHKDKMLPSFISTDLIQSSDIEQLRRSPDYSLAFKIVINPSLETKTSNMCKETVQSAVAALHQLRAEAVRKEADKTDERIRVYTDQQYEMLTQFQDRTQLEHETLIRLLHDAEVAEEAVEIPRSAKKPTTPLSPNARPSVYSPDIAQYMDSPGAVRISGRRAIRSKSLFSPSTAVGVSSDVDGVFNLEGMDDMTSELVASEGESDTDHDDSGSHDEGIDIHRQRSNAASIARSLPVNVPVFPNRLQLEPVEIHPAHYEEGNHTDIAASIKALARSVHQDVFGELPRPRFSTQI